MTAPVQTKLVDVSETAQYLRSHDRYLILTHKRPDGDTLGSAAALTDALRAMGKTAWMLENPGVTQRYAFLTENRIAPAEYVPETVVSVDVADKRLLPENALAYQKDAYYADFSIDHHDAARSFAPFLLVDSEAAATGELIFVLLAELGVECTPALADALYTAVSTDTGCFKYGNTTANTHRIAAALCEAGAQVAVLNKNYFETRSRSQIAVENLLWNRLRFYAGGQAVLAALTAAEVEATGATEDDMESLSGLPRTMEGVRVAVTLTEKPEGVKMSVRSDGVIRACDVCKQLNGGGHAAAAGALIQDTLEEAVKLAVLALHSQTEDLPWKENELPV